MRGGAPAPAPAHGCGLPPLTGLNCRPVTPALILAGIVFAGAFF